jgi:uncharacterized membrane protein YebE (DUF533 family)
MTTDMPPVAPPPAPNNGKEGISPSLYNMWRCVICIAHADGIIQPEERQYLEQVFANLDRTFGLTPTQKMTLAADLEIPQNLADLLAKITEPEYRGMLIHFGTIIANADGIVTENEERLLDMLHAQQMDSIDAEKLREDIRRDMEEHKNELDADVAEMRADVRGRSPVLKALDRLMLKRFGIDMLR